MSGKGIVYALWIGFALLSEHASAQMNCRISLAQVDFGVYLPSDALPLDVTGQLDVSCRGRAGLFLISLSPGNSGSFASREMTSGPFVMAYNIFRNAARTLVWGDGTGGSVINGRIKWRNGRQDFSLPAYGRVPARQSVGAGSYFDSLLVTVYF